MSKSSIVTVVKAICLFVAILLLIGGCGDGSKENMYEESSMPLESGQRIAEVSQRNFDEWVEMHPDARIIAIAAAENYKLIIVYEPPEVWKSYMKVPTEAYLETSNVHIQR